MSQNISDRTAPPTAATRNARPVSAPRPTPISAIAMASPIGTAIGSARRTRSAMGETRMNAAIWAWMEVALDASRKAGSSSLSRPAYRNVTPRKRRSGRRAAAGTRAKARSARSDRASVRLRPGAFAQPGSGVAAGRGVAAGGGACRATGCRRRRLIPSSVPPTAQVPRIVIRRARPDRALAQTRCMASRLT